MSERERKVRALREQKNMVGEEQKAEAVSREAETIQQDTETVPQGAEIIQQDTETMPQETVITSRDGEGSQPKAESARGEETEVETAQDGDYQEAVRLTREKVMIHELINFDKEPEQPVKVSIVVPVCNVEQYLRECLDSCVNQTLKEIEIICVNDGSTDGCLDILKEYAEADERVKVISKDNAGYGHTMNLGMDMARGKYIGIVESDDFVELNMYEELYRTAEENALDLVKADFNRFKGKKGNYSLSYNKVARNDENYNRVIDPSKEIECFRFIMNTWSGIYSRKFLVEKKIRHNETPGASFQDNGFWFKTFAEAKRIMFCDKAYYMNRRDNPNSSVYDSKKVYIANEEYQYIHDYLVEEKGSCQQFMYIFSQKKFHTYMFTLNRIASEFKKEYIYSFSKDFKEAEAKGELNQAYFTNLEWEKLHWIMRDPDSFYYQSYMSRIKVSVIIAAYNVDQYISECMDSLLAQTFQNFEVICIDDGSTDRTYDVLLDYSLTDDRVRLFHQENKGAGAARNFGLSMAEGKYVIFVDSDDYFDKNMLKETYARARQTDSDICIFKSKQLDSQTGEITDCKFSVKEQYIPKKDVFSLADISGNPFISIMGWVWDKLYKRTFILNNGLQFQEQRTTNDMYFAFASLLHAVRITVLNKPLYYQRRNVPTSLSNTRFLSWECFYHALMKVRNEIDKMGLMGQYRQDFINYALHSCLWNLTTLPQEQKFKLFEKLKTEWFADLEIEDYGKEFYQNQKEYEQFLDILQTVDEGGFWSYEINRLQRENEELKSPARRIRVSAKESLTEAEIVEKLTWNREQKRILTTEINNLKAENEEIKSRSAQKNTDVKNVFEIRFGNEEMIRQQISDGFARLRGNVSDAEDYRMQLILTRASFTYKLGSFLTWLPRKVIGFFKKY